MKSTNQSTIKKNRKAKPVRKWQTQHFINAHHVMDANMYEAILKLQGSKYADSINLVEGRQLSLPATAAATGTITAAAHWWGINIAIPEGPLQDLYTAADIVSAFIGLAGAGFGAAGVPPLAVCGAIVAAFITLEEAVIKAIDDGQGVYFSWSWLQVPFMITPPYVGAQPVITPIK